MNKSSGEVLALALLSAGEASHAFSAFLPSAFTTRNWVVCGTPEEVASNIANLRSGYKPAVLFGVGLGALVSVIARSPLPAIFAGATSLAMITLYEQSLPAELQLRNPFEIFTMPAPGSARLNAANPEAAPPPAGRTGPSAPTGMGI